MEGKKVRTTSLYDGEAKEIAHVKHVSDLISKVSAWIYILYTKIWKKKKIIWVFNTNGVGLSLIGSVQAEVGWD